MEQKYLSSAPRKPMDGHENSFPISHAPYKLAIQEAAEIRGVAGFASVRKKFELPDITMNPYTMVDNKP